MKKILVLGIMVLFLTMSVSGVIGARNMEAENKENIIRNPGDLDLDWDVDIDDYYIIRDTFGMSDALYGDFNNDDILDDNDLSMVVALQGTNGPSQADLNNDGVVNSFDKFLWFRYRANPTPIYPDFNPSADYDDDGIITFVDYQIWMMHYNNYMML